MDVRNLHDRYIIGGYTFRLNGDVYECRGREVIDNYGDPWPEESLIEAGRELAEEFVHLGFDAAFSTFGEKGWVYVYPEG